MRLVYLYSVCLIVGMLGSQGLDLTTYRSIFTFLADCFLAYIMMEVGLEFRLDKSNWRAYVKDYIIAALAAALPWLFCFAYFMVTLKGNTWEELLLIARFAAPTSSGILFSMLAAAGLALTWLFRKVQILAILDDVDTILLLIPLQFLIGGAPYGLVVMAIMVVILIILAWKYLHQLRLPSGRIWLFIYSASMAALVVGINKSLHIEMEILLPAFVLGSLLYNPHLPKHDGEEHLHEHAFIEPEERPLQLFDRSIKIAFMLVVGLLIPKIEFKELGAWLTIKHVLFITLLSNIGKCVPLFCYRDEASLRERVAVSIGMFPRGEVGAGILLLAIEHGVEGSALTIAGLSLLVNLLLTGLFIFIVIKLVRLRAA